MATSTTKLTHPIRLARSLLSCFIKNAPRFGSAQEGLELGSIKFNKKDSDVEDFAMENPLSAKAERSGKANLPKPPPVVKQKAPSEEWEQIWDESSGANYWFNHETQESSWETPA